MKAHDRTTGAAMYETILVTLETTPTDRAIIDHVKQLAKVMSSKVVLLHVATGVPAQFHGAEAAGQEVEQDREYLRRVKAEFEVQSIPVRTELAFGDPVKEIVRWVQEQGCDLVAMSTHGHQFVADLILGATASRVQHSISVPVLLLRAR
jgi:nucleotide-binding universal stress UspA family protein